MKGRNTIGKTEYIVGNLWFSGLLFFVFSKAFYAKDIWEIPFYGKILTGTQTAFGMLIFCAIHLLVGLVLTQKARRNAVELNLNVTIPHALFFAVQGWFLVPIFTYVVFLVWLIWCVLHGVVLISKGIPDVRDKQKIVRKRVLQFLLGTRRKLFYACMFCVLVTCALGFLTLDKSEEATAEAVTQAEEEIFAENMDILKNLHPSKWKNLSMEDRLVVMQTVVDIEVDYLGVPDPLQVQVEVMSFELLGRYDHENRVVKISEEHLQKSESLRCLNTAIHEVLHSYQWALFEAYQEMSPRYNRLRDFTFMEKIGDGLTNYISEGEAYFSQTIETEARYYAETRVEKVYYPSVFHE